MIRRYFLRCLALLPLSALAAPQFARAAIPTGTPELLPGRIDLLLRMGRIHALRRMIDTCYRDLDSVSAKYGFRETHPTVTFHTFHAAWIVEADPIWRRVDEAEKLLEELEREPLDALSGDPEVRPGGALEEFIRAGALTVDQIRQLEGLAPV